MRRKESPRRKKEMKLHQPRCISRPTQPGTQPRRVLEQPRRNETNIKVDTAEPLRGKRGREKREQKHVIPLPPGWQGAKTSSILLGTNGVQCRPVAGKQSYELWAEAIRDVGILLFVFAPLDTLLKSGHGSRIDWLIAGSVAVLGLIFIAVGVKMGAEK